EGIGASASRAAARRRVALRAQRVELARDLLREGPAGDLRALERLDRGVALAARGVGEAEEAQLGLRRGAALARALDPAPGHLGDERAKFGLAADRREAGVVLQHQGGVDAAPRGGAPTAVGTAPACAAARARRKRAEAPSG